MKKVTAVLAALLLALAIGGTVQAGNHKGGMDGGCGDCNPAGAPAPTEQLRKFQADTIDMRQEMMIKRFEIQRENLKATPDNAKIIALRADITAIQAKINDIRIQSGLPDKGKRDGECGPKAGKYGKGIKGGCGQTGGCNGGPCGSR